MFREGCWAGALDVCPWSCSGPWVLGVLSGGVDALAEPGPSLLPDGWCWPRARCLAASAGAGSVFLQLPGIHPSEFWFPRYQGVACSLFLCCLAFLRLGLERERDRGFTHPTRHITWKRKAVLPDTSIGWDPRRGQLPEEWGRCHCRWSPCSACCVLALPPQALHGVWEMWNAFPGLLDVQSCSLGAQRGAASLGPRTPPCRSLLGLTQTCLGHSSRYLLL